MPEDLVTEDDVDLLECGCKREEALVEEVYVKLGIIGSDIAANKPQGQSSGWKALRRPERERILIILELLGFEMNDLLELIQD